MRRATRRGWQRLAACLAMSAVLVAALGAAAPAAGARGRPPEAPTLLTVDDRVDPLGVAGTPRFGWLPQDGDPGEVQTAYRITVAREGGPVVWDSGKVLSSEQSYVPYGGPPLEPGTAYTWTVRTWDRDDQVSPPATGRFETGLGDDDWEGAQWIRRDATGNDRHTLLRTEVEVAASPVVRARAYLATVHIAELFLNGVRVDRLDVVGYDGETYYRAIDVTDAVTAGEPLAIGIHHRWYGSGQGRAATPPGVLLKLVVEHADGSRQVIVTDGSWRVAPDPSFIPAGNRNGEGLRIEHQDARGRIDGWNLPGFDASGAPWAAPTVVGTHPVEPWTPLHALETRMVETRVLPERLLTADDGTVVADFGTIIPARPAVWFDEGVEGRTLNLRAGFRLEPDGRVSTSTLRTQGTNMVYPYTQVDGPQQYQAFSHLGFRYVEIPGAGEDIDLEDVSAVVVHTDFPEERAAAFASSDPTLNAVWDLVVRSARYSIQETFVDTPTREQAQFLGDTVDISYATMAALGERDHTQQAMQEFLWSSDRYWTSGDDLGRYNAVYPNGDGKRDIPDYSLMLVNWVWRYYLETGDEAMLVRAYPQLRDTADYVLRHIPADGPTAGLVTRLSGGSGQYLYGIVDWPAPGRFGYDMSAAARTTINAQSVDVLRTVAAIGEVVGAPAAEVDAYAEAADALAARMNETLRRPDGVYVDGLSAAGEQSEHAGQHSTSYAIAYGIAPEEDWPALAEHLASMGMRQGPMTAHWLLQALSDADRPDAVLDLLTDADDLGWANILAQDGTFTWEAWTLDPGTNFSESHGWGSQAAVDILQTLLGVRVSSPGAATVDVVPPADSGLDWAAGTVHTQRGPVSVHWRERPNGMWVDVDVPVNVTARVALPQVEGRTYRPTGRSPAVRVGVEDGREIFEVGSGRSVFTTVAAAAGDRG